MEALIDFLHRYLAPFLTGVCMAGATVVHSVPQAAVLLVVAVVFGYFGFPAGGRMIKRITGVSS